MIPNTPAGRAAVPLARIPGELRKRNQTVVLKKLNNSNNITSKELNEVRTLF